MPTIKPRVQVTLEPETHNVIERFARLQNRTRGSVISDLLNEISRPLARTVALLEAAQEAPNEVKKGLRAVVEDLHGELMSVSGEANRQYELAMERIAQSDREEASAAAVDPHVVTRGSGTQPPAPAKPSKRSSSRSKSRD